MFIQFKSKAPVSQKISLVMNQGELEALAEALRILTTVPVNVMNTHLLVGAMVDGQRVAIGNLTIRMQADNNSVRV